MQTPRRLTLTNIVFVLIFAFPGQLAWADLSKAETITTNVIFDMDASDFVSYRAVKSLFGDYLELTFADNTPRDIAKSMIDAIKSQSPGVRISENFRGGSCARFSKGSGWTAPTPKQ